MATRKPKYAVLGNLPDDLTEEISSAVEIQPPTSAVEEIDGLFIHGPTASPDLATLEHHLKARKILTFYQPTDEHLSHMLKLVGYAPASGIPIVSCYRNSATQNSTVFQTLQTTTGFGFRDGGDQKGPSDSDGTVTVITPALAPHLTSAQTVLQNGVPPRPGLIPLIAGYSGQQWGTLRVVEALDNSTLKLIPYQPNSTFCCDAYWKLGDDPQPGTALMHYSDYYVYWANGNDGTGTACYCLIRVDGGYFTAGKSGGCIQRAYGYGSGLFQLYPINLAIDPSTPDSTAWMLTSLGSSPGATPTNSDGSANPNPVNVYAPALSLTFHGITPGKSNQDWQWSVGKDASGQPIPVDSLLIPGWGIDLAYDNSTVFHQVDVWNTFAYPWKYGDWTIFWGSYTSAGGTSNSASYLKELGPPLSMGRIPFSQVSSWLIQCPSPQGGPPYPVQSCVVNMLPPVLTDNNPAESQNGLNTLWQYMAWRGHGATGCVSGSDLHIWFNYFYGCYDASSQGDTLDLGAIVNHTAFSQT